MKTVESSNEEGSSESRSSKNHEMMEEFKKQLMLKRAARQQAIAVISSEMERLRQELEKEKTGHVETKKELQDLKEMNEQIVQAEKTDKCKCKDTPITKTSELVEASRLIDLLKVILYC